MFTLTRIELTAFDPGLLATTLKVVYVSPPNTNCLLNEASIMAAIAASISHTRTRSLRIPGADSFLKRPVQPASPTKDHNGPSHVNLFLTNLRLLNFDQRKDWPDITAETFSTKDNQQNIKKRIQCVEWALYQLFCIWDPQDARDKLAPNFPPLEPLQSIKLRTGLYTCLDHAKKNGVLGRDAVLRKTMLDECKGERLEEVLAVFSNAVLKRLAAADSNGTGAVAQTLALEKFSYTSVPEGLSTLVLAHTYSLRRTLEQKDEKRKRYSDFFELLKLKDAQLTRRSEELKLSIEEDESTEYISKAETYELQERARKNWYGSNGWLESVIHDDGSYVDDGLLSRPFDNVWKHAEAGRVDEIEDRRGKGLLEQLDARVEEQNSRLEKWQSFGEQIAARRNGAETEKPKAKKAPADIVLKFDDHAALQLKKPAAGEEKFWEPRLENARILQDLQRELANVRKPRHVPSPKKHRASPYENPASRSPSPKPFSKHVAQDQQPEQQPESEDERESVNLDESTRPPSPATQVPQDAQAVEMDDVKTGEAEHYEPECMDEDEDYDMISAGEAQPSAELETTAEVDTPGRLKPSLAAQSVVRDSLAPLSQPHFKQSRSPLSMEEDHSSMLPPPAPQSTSHFSSSINSNFSPPTQAELGSSVNTKIQQMTLASESPDAAQAILNSMDMASPSPVKQHPLTLAERTQLSMSASTRQNHPALSQNISFDAFDDLPELMPVTTPRREMSLGERAKMNMSASIRRANTDSSTINGREKREKKNRFSTAHLEAFDDDETMTMDMSTPSENPRIRLELPARAYSDQSMSGFGGSSSSLLDFTKTDIESHPATSKVKAQDTIAERTRAAMSSLNFDQITKNAQLERSRSVKIEKKKKRESFLPPPRFEEEDTLRLIEQGATGKVDYEDVFRSRPKIVTSPAVSPVKRWRDGSVSPFPR